MLLNHFIESAGEPGPSCQTHTQPRNGNKPAGRNESERTVSGIGEELADSTRGRRASEGQGHLNSASRRVASLLPTSRLTLAIRLAPGDIDQINGETASAGRDSCASLQTYAPST
jgi:hypothetical protein